MKRLLIAPFALALGAALSFGAPACSDPDTGPLRAPCTPPPRPTSRVVLASAPPFGERTFDSPIEIGSGPGGRFYVLEQAGIARVVPPDGGEPTVAIDLTARVVGRGEAGLLGIAFDPAFGANGFVYLHFNQAISPEAGAFQSVIARFESKDGGASFDPATEKRLLVVDQPFGNHNGGKIAFGPDGFLYIALGDGGSGGDPRGNGQNTNTLLGKILRIDPKAGDPYAIPPDNPFAGGGGRPEIYALGLRNPWKFAFDGVTGDLWCADVGQSRFEEINRIILGGNYGWNTREGAHCFPAGASCSSEGLIDPVVEYARTEGVSVTGGYVYRGARIPSLAGKFIYGDYGSGNIWAVDQDASGAYFGALLASQTQVSISTFAQGADGEVWVADHQSGRVHALVAAPAEPPPDGGGAKLSETGCVDATGAESPSSALVAYDVSSPLWSDGADKHRALYVPDGKKIKVAPDGDFDVPPGSVAVKTFTIGGKRIETRLFVRYDDGSWAGYSYEWDDAQTDATLLTGGRTKDLPDGRTWTFPSREECFACHTAAAGFTLGLEARQVDVERFAAHLEAPLGRDAFPKLAAADSPSASEEERARGYLHANCSVCHRAGSGAGAATIDLRVDRRLAEMRVCNVAPSAGDLDAAGAMLVSPGDPSRSILTLRMRSQDRGRMPPLASRVVDEAGASAVEAWIRGLTACP